jgi:hypothetical protein
VTRRVRVCENLWALKLNSKDIILGVPSCNIGRIYNEVCNDDKFIKIEI